MGPDKAGKEIAQTCLTRLGLTQEKVRTGMLLMGAKYPVENVDALKEKKRRQSREATERYRQRLAESVAGESAEKCCGQADGG